MNHKNSAKEEQILQAAESLFLTKGFTNTSTTEIAQAAGCNQALVHYYFRTKENLFQQIFLKKATSLLAGFSQAIPAGMAFTDRLRVRMDIYFDFIKANQPLPFMVINELVTNPQRRQSLCTDLQSNPHFADLYRQFDEEVQTAVNAGEICPINTIDLYIDIFSLTVCTFISLPVYRSLCTLSPEAEQQYIRQRKEELITIILKRLQP